MASCSNWAKDSSTSSGNLPIEVGHEGHLVALEYLDHLRKVGQAAHQTVDRVGHFNVDLAARVDAPLAATDSPIPMQFGTRTTTQPNCVWFGDARTMPIKCSGGSKK